MKTKIDSKETKRVGGRPTVYQKCLGCKKEGGSRWLRSHKCSVPISQRGPTGERWASQVNKSVQLYGVLKKLKASKRLVSRSECRYLLWKDPNSTYRIKSPAPTTKKNAANRQHTILSNTYRKNSRVVNALNTIMSTGMQSKDVTLRILMNQSAVSPTVVVHSLQALKKERTQLGMYAARILRKLSNA